MKKQKIFTAAFFCLCLVFSVGMLFSGGGSAARETQAARPALKTEDGTWNPDFCRELRDYTAQNFALRQQCVTASAALCAHVFQTSSNRDVVLGRDGWLYFADSIPSYTGGDPLTDRELFSLVRTVSLMNEYCARSGVDFAFTVAPNKNSLYDENLPARYQKCAVSDLDRVTAALSAAGVPCADLKTALSAQEETLYYATDTHWTPRGAALGMDTINAALGRSSNYFGGSFSRQGGHTGDLYGMLYPAGGLQEPLFAPDGLQFSYVTPFKTEEDMHIVTRGGGQGRLLLYRDSFGNALYPFAADSFADAVISRSTIFSAADVQAANADTLVVEVVERELRRVISKAHFFPSPERDAVPAGTSDTAVHLAETELNGCAVLTGFVEAADADSPIYVRAGGRVCEAMPAGEGDEPFRFTAVLPLTAYNAQDISFLVKTDGTLVETKNVSFDFEEETK